MYMGDNAALPINLVAKLQELVMEIGVPGRD